MYGRTILYFAIYARSGNYPNYVWVSSNWCDILKSENYTCLFIACTYRLYMEILNL